MCPEPTVHFRIFLPAHSMCDAATRPFAKRASQEPRRSGTYGLHSCQNLGYFAGCYSPSGHMTSVYANAVNIPRATARVRDACPPFMLGRGYPARVCHACGTCQETPPDVAIDPILQQISRFLPRNLGRCCDSGAFARALSQCVEHFPSSSACSSARQICNFGKSQHCPTFYVRNRDICCSAKKSHHMWLPFVAHALSCA